jgi:uncharacterized protein YbbC (DUF1343 family)
MSEPSRRRFRPGICAVLARPERWLVRGRTGLVTHSAAVDGAGCPSAERLWEHSRVQLSAVFGPEHGFYGLGGAGAPCRDARHPLWHIPVHSLYGAVRKPTAAMLRDVDVLLFDLQDLGARCYTYASTLRLVLEAAAEFDKPVVVADRPIPLPRVADGPLVEPDCASFVSAVPVPLCYGMTPGETALWMKENLRLPVRLRVAPMAGYARQPGWGPDWPPWIPPSPAILSWESARCYPITVLFEGLPTLDHGRGTPMPFRLFGAPWMRASAVCEFLSEARLPGVAFHPHRYCAARPPHADQTLDGVRITVTDPSRVRPALTAITLINGLQRLYGRKRVWTIPAERAAFFDKLAGSRSVRAALLDGEAPRAIAARWAGPLAAFLKSRKPCLLY